MTREGARRFARRRLQERTADNWSDAEINELNNEALHLVQKEIIKVSADEFFTIATADTVVGQEFYRVPDNFWYEFEIGYKASSSLSDWPVIEKGNYHALKTHVNGSAKYSRRGQYFSIRPIPSQAVTAGLRILYCASLSLDVGASEVVRDANVIPVHPALHMAVPIGAALLARGETFDDSTEDGKMWVALIGDIPTFYHAGGQAMQVHLDLRKNYRGSRLSNGIDG